MSVVVVGAATEDARKYLPQILGGIVAQGYTVGTSSIFTHFKVGEGGWIDPGSGRVARAPDATLRRLDNSIQDIDSIVDPTRLLINQRYPASERATFMKALTPADISFVAPTKLQIRCFLDFGEFNDDGFGDFPEIWEVGIFGTHPTVGGQKLMWGYGTFLMTPKNPGITFEKLVRFVF